jgi:hypothetical protein
MSITVHARPSAPIRLTRRGRVVIVCLARATSGGGRGPAVTPESVVVGPHDTLWGIAVRTRPGVDPRVTVQRMIDLNSLPSAVVNPGQKVYLPSR